MLFFIKDQELKSMIFNIDNISQTTFQSVKAAYDDGIRDFQFVIDSYGGSFDAGLRIYDLMRSDAENVVAAEVDGNCMSAATIILLSAPLERRTATKNSCFMCHSPLMSFTGDINKTTADQLKGDIDAAYNQLQSIYLERTNSADVIENYMRNEQCFYADEAVRLGFIARTNELYNLKPNKSNFDIMNKRFLKQLVNKIVNGLKNEVVKTKDGVEFDVVALEIGSPADVADGVYELEDGTVITVEAGVIVDIVTPVEETVVENEGEDEAKVEEQADAVEQVLEEAAIEVEEAVTEEEITEIVEQAVEELKEEIVNKYAPLAKLVNELGGVKKLVALKNVKNDKKAFVSEQPKNEKRSLRDLMNLGK